jgi:hypothetical protein
MLPNTLLDVPSKLNLTAIKLIKSMSLHADAAHVERAESCADALFNIMTLSMFPKKRIDMFNNRINYLRQHAYKRRISNILGQIKVNAHGGTYQIEPKAIEDINHFVSLALLCGAENTYRDNIRRELEELRYEEMSCVSVENDRINASQPVACTYSEKRRSIRFVTPILQVKISGITHKSIDWSPFGLFLDRFDCQPSPGSRLKLLVHCSEAGCGGPVNGYVIDRPHIRKKIVLDLHGLSPIILNIMHNLRVRGIHPSS